MGSHDNSKSTPIEKTLFYLNCLYTTDDHFTILTKPPTHNNFVHRRRNGRSTGFLLRQSGPSRRYEKQQTKIYPFALYYFSTIYRSKYDTYLSIEGANHQAYASPGASISTLLPYGGQGPPPSGPTTYPTNTPTSSAPANTSYHYPTNPPTSAAYPVNSAAPPPPFPPCSTGVPPNNYPPNSSAPSPYAGGYPPNTGPNPAYPPAGYPPQPANPQAPNGYPTGNIESFNSHYNCLQYLHPK